MFLNLEFYMTFEFNMTIGRRVSWGQVEAFYPEGLDFFSVAYFSAIREEGVGEWRFSWFEEFFVGFIEGLFDYWFASYAYVCRFGGTDKAERPV